MSCHIMHHDAISYLLTGGMKLVYEKPELSRSYPQDSVCNIEPHTMPTLSGNFTDHPQDSRWQVDSTYYMAPSCIASPGFTIEDYTVLMFCRFQ